MSIAEPGNLSASYTIATCKDEGICGGRVVLQVHGPRKQKQEGKPPAPVKKEKEPKNEKKKKDLPLGPIT